MEERKEPTFHFKVEPWSILWLSKLTSDCLNSLDLKSIHQISTYGPEFFLLVLQVWEGGSLCLLKICILYVCLTYLGSWWRCWFRSKKQQQNFLMLMSRSGHATEVSFQVIHEMMPWKSFALHHHSWSSSIHDILQLLCSIKRGGLFIVFKDKEALCVKKTSESCGKKVASLSLFVAFDTRWLWDIVT